MRPAAILLTVVTVFSGAMGALAQDSNAAPSTPAPSETPNFSTPDTQNLSCIANGQAYVPGEIACVPACHGRQRLARCDALADASADWTTISDSCPSARATPLPPGNPAYPTALICTLMTDVPFARSSDARPSYCATDDAGRAIAGGSAAAAVVTFFASHSEARAVAVRRSSQARNRFLLRIRIHWSASPGSERSPATVRNIRPITG
jgi:hypothetical protein